MYPLLVALFVVVLRLVDGRHNVTIDDNDPSIIYAPPGAWNRSAANALDSGGSHMLTQNPAGTASFNFTGVAIYFLSPLWPYLVNTAVSLDSGPVTLIDLVDHSSPTSLVQGPETVQSHVVWNATGLANETHRLLISVGAGQPFAIVDGLIYTVLDPADLGSSSVSPPATTAMPATTSTDRIIASSIPTPTSTPKKHVLPIALGTVLAVLGLLLIAAAFWFCCRPKKRPTSETWTVQGPPSSTIPSTPQMTGSSSSPITPGQKPHSYNQRYPMPQSGQTAWQNPRYGYVGMPLPVVVGNQAYSEPYDPNYPQEGDMDDPSAMRAPNRYQHGANTLSTITEKSTPYREGQIPLANTGSPASLSTDLAYHTPQTGSELGSELRSNSALGHHPHQRPDAMGNGATQRSDVNVAYQRSDVPGTYQKPNVPGSGWYNGGVQKEKEPTIGGSTTVSSYSSTSKQTRAPSSLTSAATTSATSRAKDGNVYSRTK